MNIPAWVCPRAWHGFRGAVVGGSAAIALALKNAAWPSSGDWLIITMAILRGLVNGVDSYRKEPQ